MKALCWYGTKDVRVTEVPDPELLRPRDALVRVTKTSICGSDIHLYDGLIPTLEKGDILGHEFMGEVLRLGPGVENLEPGDRVVVPFTISCGGCFFCEKGLFSLCDDSNPNAGLAEERYGHVTAGLFGHSHMLGGYAGGQAQLVRVPFADVGPIVIPDVVPDEKALFLSDVLPTAYMAAENCEIEDGDAVAIWGCGPVGLLAIVCARLLGAERVLAIDDVPARLRMAEKAGAETIDFSEIDPVEALLVVTGGAGPDRCIDAVGMEAHGRSIGAIYDRAKTTAGLATDRPTALRQAIQACRKGGVVSIPGVYAGSLDRFPLGAAFAKGLTLRMGQTHVQRYMEPLLDLIREGELDPSFIITHRMPLEEAARGYEIFAPQDNDCVKVVLDAA